MHNLRLYFTGDGYKDYELGNLRIYFTGDGYKDYGLDNLRIYFTGDGYKDYGFIVITAMLYLLIFIVNLV